MSKAIRLQILNILDNDCAKCQIKVERKWGPREFEAYCLGSCPIGNSMQKLSEQLTQQKRTVSNKKVIDHSKHKFRWDEDLTKQLVQLKEEGMSFSQVAEILDKTIASVKKRYYYVMGIHLHDM